jgi:hypothetical protein
MIGNTIDANERRPGVEWFHSAQDAAAMVRDFTKWDDLPISLPHFAESTVRAYKISMTPPREPVVIVLDSTLMEAPIPKDAALRIPKLTLDGAPQGDSGSVMEAAKLLVAAENPVLIAGDFVNSEASMQHLIEFAEALQIPVIDQARNLPSRHPLNQMGGRALIPEADVILGLQVTDFWGTVHAAQCQADQHQRAGTLHEEQLPGFSALPGIRYRHGGGSGDNPPGSNGGGQAIDYRRSQASLSGSQIEACRGQPKSLRTRAGRGHVWVGVQPHQHFPAISRSLECDQKRGLGRRPILR